jgi:hypothetical protein
MSEAPGEHCWEAVLDRGAITPAMARHLAACADCRRMVDGVDAAVCAVRAAAPPLPARAVARLRAAIRRRSRA